MSRTWPLSSLSLAALTLAALGLLLAGTFPAAATPAARSGPSPMAANPPNTQAAFEEAFRAAFTSGELARTLPLFYWQGMQDDHRAFIVQLIAQDLAKTLIRITWLPPLSPDEDAGRRDPALQSNLPVSARLAADFVDARGVPSRSVHDIGQHGGVYYIVLFEPVPRSAGAGPHQRWLSSLAPRQLPVSGTRARLVSRQPL